MCGLPDRDPGPVAQRWPPGRAPRCLRAVAVAGQLAAHAGQRLRATGALRSLRAVASALSVGV